ncbi:MAG: hypothetical protein AAF611_17475 [Bacteroidota bacterium]
MSQNYDFKSLHYGNSENTETDKDLNENGLIVFETGNSKTIDFIKKDNTRQNFPYSHYLTAWTEVQDKKRVIKIIFATHQVTIHGYCLDIIYDHVCQFNLKSLKANDERYVNDLLDDTPFITSIMIEWKGKEHTN